MKSSANLIGAVVLGGMAKLLEDAARNADIKLIEALHDIFIREWRDFKDKLKECVNILDDSQVEQLREEVGDYKEIIGFLERLKEAMAEMDIDLMDEMMAKLEGYQYQSQVQQNIEKLSVHVTNMDSEQANNVIEEIISQIK